NGRFRVYVGYFTREAEAEKLTHAMHELGYDAFVKHLRNPLVEGIPFQVVYQGPDDDEMKLPISLKHKLGDRASGEIKNGLATRQTNTPPKTAIVLKSKPVASQYKPSVEKPIPPPEEPSGLAKNEYSVKETKQVKESYSGGSKLTDIDQVLAENTDEEQPNDSKTKVTKNSPIDFSEVFMENAHAKDVVVNQKSSTLEQIDQILPKRGDFIPLYDFIYELDGEVTDSSMLVETIKIYNKNAQGKRGDLMQKIIGLRSEIQNPEDRLVDFVVEDLNFDGIMDIRLMDFIPTGPRVSYLYWTFDEGMQQFVSHTALEQLRSPTVDYDNEWLISTWGTNQSNGTHFYRFEGEELVLFRHELRERQANNTYLLTVFEKQGENARLQKVLEKVEE
ncbi:MAG: XAC2610-related protein, partial [Chitinophagales bacterium]